jgi:hypothetical protein
LFLPVRTSAVSCIFLSFVTSEVEEELVRHSLKFLFLCLCSSSFVALNRLHGFTFLSLAPYTREGIQI